MHASSLTEPGVDTPAAVARQGGALALAQMLADSRRDTLALFAMVEDALPGLRVPQRPELNPPLWELGHIGWFQEYWLSRFSARARGAGADPDAPRTASLRQGADELYNSSRVAHDSRWGLALPDAQATRQDLAAILSASQDLLADLAHGQRDQGPDRDKQLYFFRLALLHEDMHHEAGLYMAQNLGLSVPDARWRPQALPAPPAPLHLAAGPWPLGAGRPAPGQGFFFDNELGHQPAETATTRIDAQVLRWADYLPFVEAGGYAETRWWTEAGWAWRQAAGLQAPRDLRRRDGAWQQRQFGHWQALDPGGPAVHLGAHEALAWCRWAGRRLPTEAEWDRAAAMAGAGDRAEASADGFRWGDVWEWTASAFAPYPGFEPHPYRDYSAPWFDGRPVLRGASHLTQPRLRHRRYRNFFAAGRHDVPAGFRSCAG